MATSYLSPGVYVEEVDRGSKPIEAAGMSLVFKELEGSTGLQLKTDPGVPYVYAGFAGLMLTTILSYASHSQVWAMETEDGSVLVGGRSNRAKLAFAEEIAAAVRPQLGETAAAAR